MRRTDIIRMINENKSRIVELNKEYETIKHKRTEEFRSRKTNNRKEVKELNQQIEDYNLKLHKREMRIYQFWTWVISITFTLVLISGIGMLVWSGYIKDHYMVVESHNYINMLRGGNGYMSEELFRTLYFTNIFGVLNLLVGVIGLSWTLISRDHYY